MARPMPKFGALQKPRHENASFNKSAAQPKTHATTSQVDIGQYSRMCGCPKNKSDCLELKVDLFRQREWLCSQAT